MRPSITKQANAEFIDPRWLKQSPRNYNPGLCEFNGRLWMAYRSHRMDQDGRCGIAICDLIDGKPQSNQWLALGGATGKEHHEDPRLFMFAGKLHVAYSETSFPRHRNYISVMKYARLEHTRNGWKVAEVFRPRYGNNHADLMEKNWQFFEKDNRLHAIYCAEPMHVVIQLNGAEVVNEFKTAAVRWPFGEIRGGSPPIRLPLMIGESSALWITFFHSSTPAQEGNWRRYWMGAYIFDDEFNVGAITRRPIAGGSEQDDHGHDPRTDSSWKPYVVFPGGAVDLGGELGHLVAVGVNDWQIAMVKVPFRLHDYCAPGANMECDRRFKTVNGQRPVKMMKQDRTPIWIEWDRKPSQIGGAHGETTISDPWLAEEFAHMPGISEVFQKEKQTAV